MDYSYVIDNINTLKEVVGVVYIPSDNSLLSHFKQIAVDEFNPTGVEKAIVLNAPIELWALELEKRALHGVACQHLVGKTNVASEKATIVARETANEKIPLEDIVQDLKTRLRFEVAGMMDGYRQKYSAEEVETWDKLFQQAQEVVHVNGDLTKATISVRYLSDMAEAKGRDLLEFAKKVIEKHDVYETTKEQLVVEVNKRLGVIDTLVQQHKSKEIGRHTLIEELEKLPFFQPTDENE